MIIHIYELMCVILTVMEMRMNLLSVIWIQVVDIPVVPTEMMLVSPAVSQCNNFSCVHIHNILFFIADSLTAGAIVAIVLGAICFILIITSVIVLCLCCCIPGCPCYCASTQNRRHWLFFPPHNTQPQTTETSVTYTTNNQQQQSFIKAADPLPSKEVPYEESPMDQPPPYQLHDQQPYPPPLTTAFQ